MSTICFTVGAGVNYKRIFFLLAVDKKVMSCVLPREGGIFYGGLNLLIRSSSSFQLMQFLSRNDPRVLWLY